MKEIFGVAASLALIGLLGFVVFTRYFASEFEKGQEPVDLELQKAIAQYESKRDDSGFVRPENVPLAETQTAEQNSDSALDVERVFTNRDGRAITATVRGVSDTYVNLVANGKLYRYPISELSDQDQEFLRQLPQSTPAVE